MIFLRNVQRAPARSVLTALGVAAGIALFVAISAITRDVHEQVAAAASAYNPRWSYTNGEPPRRSPRASAPPRCGTSTSGMGTPLRHSSS